MRSSVPKSILLVDDDEISNLFNKIFIEKLAITPEVDIAHNGEEALDFLLGNRLGTTELSTPCLLLLDINMPIMDGWQFLEQYAKHVDDRDKDEIVIVMLTTSQDQGDMINSLKNPFVKEFIQKPLSEHKFNALIKRHFNGQKTL